jgi:hypothetical protein
METEAVINVHVKFGTQNLKIPISESIRLITFLAPFSRLSQILDATVEALREELHKLTSIQPAAQKITYRGLIKENDKTLKELKIGEGTLSIALCLMTFLLF